MSGAAIAACVAAVAVVAGTVLGLGATIVLTPISLVLSVVSIPISLATTALTAVGVVAVGAVAVIGVGVAAVGAVVVGGGVLVVGGVAVGTAAVLGGGYAVYKGSRGIARYLRATEEEEERIRREWRESEENFDVSDGATFFSPLSRYPLPKSEEELGPTFVVKEPGYSIGLGWDCKGGHVDGDLVAVVYDRDGNQMTIVSGMTGNASFANNAISHTGDDRKGGKKRRLEGILPDNENVVIAFDQLPEEVSVIVVAAVIVEDKKAIVCDAYLRGIPVKEVITIDEYERRVNDIESSGDIVTVRDALDKSIEDASLSGSLSEDGQTLNLELPEGIAFYSLNHEIGACNAYVMCRFVRTDLGWVYQPIRQPLDGFSIADIVPEMTEHVRPALDITSTPRLSLKSHDGSGCALISVPFDRLNNLLWSKSQLFQLPGTTETTSPDAVTLSCGMCTVVGENVSYLSDLTGVATIFHAFDSSDKGVRIEGESFTFETAGVYRVSICNQEGMILASSNIVAVLGENTASNVTFADSVTFDLTEIHSLNDDTCNCYLVLVKQENATIEASISADLEADFVPVGVGSASLQVLGKFTNRPVGHPMPFPTPLQSYRFVNYSIPLLPHGAIPKEVQRIYVPEQVRKFKVKILEGKNLVAKDLCGKSDPYVLVTCDGTRVGKTKCKWNTLNPIWNYKATFEPEPDAKLMLEFHCWDDDFGSADDAMGTAMFNLREQILPYIGPLKLCGDDVSGSILVNIDYELQDVAKKQ